MLDRVLNKRQDDVWQLFKVYPFVPSTLFLYPPRGERKGALGTNGLKTNARRTFLAHMNKYTFF